MYNVLTIFTQLETQTKESDMCATCSRVSRDTAQGVKTCVQVSRESDPSGTDGDGKSCGSLVKAQTSARADVPTAPHFFAVRTKESNTCVQVFFSIGKLGYVPGG